MILRLLLMFFIGFVTWGLTFGRSLSFRHQRLGWLSSIIFLDEVTGISIGMFLARHGTWADAVCCALGGTFSALLVIKGKKLWPLKMLSGVSEKSPD
jgi:hypothetical protein